MDDNVTSVRNALVKTLIQEVVDCEIVMRFRPVPESDITAAVSHLEKVTFDHLKDFEEYNKRIQIRINKVIERRRMLTHMQLTKELVSERIKDCKAKMEVLSVLLSQPTVSKEAHLPMFQMIDDFKVCYTELMKLAKVTPMDERAVRKYFVYCLHFDVDNILTLIAKELLGESVVNVRNMYNEVSDVYKLVEHGNRLNMVRLLTSEDKFKDMFPAYSVEAWDKCIVEFSQLSQKLRDQNSKDCKPSLLVRCIGIRLMMMNIYKIAEDTCMKTLGESYLNSRLLCDNNLVGFIELYQQRNVGHQAPPPLQHMYSSLTMAMPSPQTAQV